MELFFSSTNGPEYGTYSYAAFLYGCTFNLIVKTKILNIKLNIKTLRKINLYTFFEDRQIPKELRL